MSVDAIGIAREFIGQDLDSDIAFELAVACAVHLSHAAFADQSRDF